MRQQDPTLPRFGTDLVPDIQYVADLQRVAPRPNTRDTIELPIEAQTRNGEPAMPKDVKEMTEQEKRERVL
ncbi:MAG: hypothetical protein ACRD8U_03205, partial [Pyrinomonadaceae bacterium]